MSLEELHAWWQPAAFAVAAVLLALLAHRLLWPVAVRLTRHSTGLHAIVARLDWPLHWVFPLLALQLVWQGAPETLPGLGAIGHLNGVLLIAALTATAIAAVGGTTDAVALAHPQDVADNLEARRIITQTRVLSRIATGVLLFAGVAFILMTFPRARQFGTSLLASAGLSALVIGIAARSVFGNLLAGLQIALSQPIRIDDVLIVENEWGRVEEITGTYVVLKIWDERRLVIPLQWFIEHPFQNWTRSSSQIIGSVFFWVDYTTDLAPIRAEATRLAEGSKDYDGRVCLLQVVDTNERAMQLRLIVSSPSAGQNWDLRCLLREGVIAFLQRSHPGALPRLRAQVEGLTNAAAGESRADRARVRPLPAETAALPPSPSPDLPETAPRQRTVKAEVDNATGLSRLTAPTGGAPAAKEPPR
jgi:small-conductance mechanosensitive channel